MRKRQRGFSFLHSWAAFLREVDHATGVAYQGCPTRVRVTVVLGRMSPVCPPAATLDVDVTRRHPPPRRWGTRAPARLFPL